MDKTPPWGSPPTARRACTHSPGRAPGTGAHRALRWSDLDLPGKAATISRSVVETEHSEIVEKDTKTHASRRIALDVGTVDVLKTHRERCTARAAACDVMLPVTAHVFSRDPDGERPWVPNEVTKDFIRIRKTVKLDTVRLHDLRHFAATRLLAAGVPVRTVSGRLGHANAATTLGVYAHFVEESDKDAAAKLGALLRMTRPATSRKRSGRSAKTTTDA
jgi:integrase